MDAWSATRTQAQDDDEYIGSSSNWWYLAAIGLGAGPG
jgi:hypothetical protein